MAGDQMPVGMPCHCCRTTPQTTVRSDLEILGDNEGDLRGRMELRIRGG